MNRLEKDYLLIKFKEIKIEAKEGKKSSIDRDDQSLQWVRFNYIVQMIDWLMDII